MGCDYYIQSELVIEYIDSNGVNSVTRTNESIEKGYILSIQNEDSDDDDDTAHKKYMAEIDRIVNEKTYVKILYENDKWVNPSYEKKYKKEIRIICPNFVKLTKIYKDYTSWQSD